MNANTICPGVTLLDGTNIGGMDDLSAFRQFGFDGATYANAINADGLTPVGVPKRGNLYRVHKMGKIERAKRVAEDIRIAKAANIEKYRRIKDEGGQGADLGLFMFQGEDEIEAEEKELGLTTTQSIADVKVGI